MYNPNSGWGAAVMASLPLTLTGKIFVVGDSSTANRDMLQEIFGRYPDPDGDIRFFDTIDAAVGACTANAGDVILVAPGHTEDIAAATSLVVDVAGVSIIGLGTGSNRPELNFSNTAGSVEMDAANTRLSNVILKADVSAVVVGVNVDADNVQIDNCLFTYNATGDDFITMIDVDGVNGAVIKDNVLKAEEGAAGCDEAIRLDDCDDVTIAGNHITGDFTDGAIIGEGAAGSNLVIKDNTIYNADTTAGFLVDLNVAFTGLLAGNRMGTLFATAPETAVDPGSLLSVENYVANAVDESGALVPTAVST
jgi:hypothetical protein